MIRPSFAVLAGLVLVASAPAQSITFTTLGPGTPAPEPPKLTTLVRLVPGSDPEAKASAAAMQKAATNADKSGTVLFSQVVPNSNWSDGPSNWNRTGQPYATTALYGTTPLAPTLGVASASPFQSFGHWTGGISGTPGTTGVTTITNTTITNNYTTRYIAPQTGTNIGSALHPHGTTHIPAHGTTHVPAHNPTPSGTHKRK